MVSGFLLLFALTLLGPVLIFTLYAHRLRSKNRQRRSTVLSGLGIAKTDNKRLVGFFHPYWFVLHLLLAVLRLLILLS